MSHCFALVMAGGRGTRFWPESTSKKPKQYLSLTSNESLLGQTLKRFDSIVSSEDIFVVTTEDQKQLALENSSNLLNDKSFVLEPAGRNTAPCIMLSCAHLRSINAKDEDVVIVVPSDHVILDTQSFKVSMNQAVKLSEQKGHIVTLGIRPTHPHTGFGYIETDEKWEENSFRVKSFKEKPSYDVAKTYVEKGRFYWNAGMFVAPLGVLEREFELHSAQMYSHYEDLVMACKGKGSIKEVYEHLEKESFDYAVMEKSSSISVVAASFDWNDLGSWDALESVIEKVEGNVLAQANGHQFLDAKGNIIFTPEKHISLIGVDDLIIVSNDKNVLIAKKDRSQDVKKVVEKISQLGDPQGIL